MKKYLLLAIVWFSFPSLAGAAMYAGTWNNTTFGSFGDVFFDIAASPPTLTVTADFDGGVFGFGDPPALILPGAFDIGGNATVGVLGDPFFGDVSGSFSALGAVTLDVTNLPLSGPSPTGFNIFSTSMDGTFDGTNISLNYLVIFNCGFPASAPCDGPGTGTEGADYALGTVTAALVPLPAAGLMLLPPALFLTRRSRRRTSAITAS